MSFFGRNNNGNGNDNGNSGGGNPPPGDNGGNGGSGNGGSPQPNFDPRVGPPLPPCRTFRVTRFKLDRQDYPGQTEQIIVVAHISQYADNGMVAFMDHVWMGPQFGVMTQMRRAFAIGQWIDLEEIPTAATSRLVQ